MRSCQFSGECSCAVFAACSSATRATINGHVISAADGVPSMRPGGVTGTPGGVVGDWHRSCTSSSGTISAADASRPSFCIFIGGSSQPPVELGDLCWTMASGATVLELELGELCWRMASGATVLEDEAWERAAGGGPSGGEGPGPGPQL